MISFIKLVFIALFVLAVSPAFSQFSASVDLGIPTGTYADNFGVGFGLSGCYEAPIMDKLNWTASAGFLSFVGKSHTVKSFIYDPGTGTFILTSATVKGSSGTLIPLTGGAKYYFQESNKGFYGAADLGLFIASGSGYSETRFGFAPGVGYRMSQFDFALRLNVVSDFSYIGLRVAYLFGGK